MRFVVALDTVLIAPGPGLGNSLACLPSVARIRAVGRCSHFKLRFSRLNAGSARIAYSRYEAWSDCHFVQQRDWHVGEGHGSSESFERMVDAAGRGFGRFGRSSEAD